MDKKQIKTLIKKGAYNLAIEAVLNKYRKKAISFYMKIRKNDRGNQKLVNKMMKTIKSKVKGLAMKDISSHNTHLNIKSSDYNIMALPKSSKYDVKSIETQMKKLGFKTYWKGSKILFMKKGKVKFHLVSPALAKRWLLVYRLEKSKLPTKKKVAATYVKHLIAGDLKLYNKFKQFLIKYVVKAGGLKKKKR